MYQRTVQAAASTVTQVASSTSVVTLAEAEPARLGLTVYNDSTAVLTLKLGDAASATSFTIKLAADGYYEVPFQYVGKVTGLWASVNGNAYVTELQ